MSYGCSYRPVPICTETAIVWVQPPVTGTGQSCSPLEIDWQALSSAEACAIVQVALNDPACVQAVCDAINAAGCLDLCAIADALPSVGPLQCIP